MAYPDKVKALTQKVYTAAQDAERLCLTTATFDTSGMARLEIDDAEPE